MQQIEIPRSQIHTPPSPNPDTINLLDYLEVIAKRWRMIVKITVAAAVISIAYSLTLPNIYKSTALILPPQQDQGLMGMMLGSVGGGMANIAGDLLGKGTTADLYVGMLKSETVKDAIIDRFKLQDRYEKKYRMDTLMALDKRAEIKSSKKEGIIAISVEDKDPKLAAEIANAFVEELGKLTIGLSVNGAKQNRGYLEPRLTQAKVDLAKAEDNLKAFQSKNKALDITEQAKGTIKGVAELMAQLALEEVRLSGLQRSLTDSSQEVKNQKLVVSNLKGQIARLEGTQKGGSIPSVGSVPGLGQEFIRLTREFKIQETLVELLTKQFEMTKLAEIKEITGLQVIQKAKVPDKKTTPKRSQIVLITTYAAFMISILLVFIIERFDRLPLEKKHRLKEQIKSILSPNKGAL